MNSSEYTRFTSLLSKAGGDFVPSSTSSRIGTEANPFNAVHSQNAFVQNLTVDGSIVLYGTPGANGMVLTSQGGNQAPSWNLPMGATGPMGTTGVTGTSGVAGIASNTGATGPIGSQGPQGLAGIASNTGATGPVGSRGPEGLAGNASNTGASGPTGPQGLSGPTGIIGPTGMTGPIGITGITGATGEIGRTGFTGSTGPLGYTGPQGVAFSYLSNERLNIASAASTQITTETISVNPNAVVMIQMNPAVFTAVTGNNLQLIEIFATTSTSESYKLAYVNLSPTLASYTVGGTASIRNVTNSSITLTLNIRITLTNSSAVNISSFHYNFFFF